MQIRISASEIKSERKADDRGRVTLGSEYAGKTVTVAVLEVEYEDDVRTDGGTQTVGHLDFCDERVVGAAENVDKRGPSEPEPYEVDVDERRVLYCTCITCKETETLLLEVGDDSPWDHDAMNASHEVEYWREA